MLSLLLISLDIFVCVALIFVVLMQRSEGGAFGMGGGPTGLVTARGAGDLLTRTTWILFSLFLGLSLALTLLGAHERATSSIVEKLKLQHANPTELNQPVAPPPAAPGTGPTDTSPGGPTPGSLLAPPAAEPPLSAPAPRPLTLPAAAPQPVAKPKPAHAAAPRTEAAPTIEAPPPPVLEAPKPASAPPATAPATGAP